MVNGVREQDGLGTSMEDVCYVFFLPGTFACQRFNVLGALNAITKELVMITEHTYINATSVCALLEKLHEQFRDLPIVLIMDNARYQRCQLVSEKAKSLNIQIIFQHEAPMFTFNLSIPPLIPHSTP